MYKHKQIMPPINNEYLYNLYYDRGLRRMLGNLMKETPEMMFIEKHVKVLDKLILDNVINNPEAVLHKTHPHTKNLSQANFIRLNREDYALSEERWQNIFYDLLQDEGGYDNTKSNKLDSYKILNYTVQGFVEELLPQETLVPAIVMTPVSTSTPINPIIDEVTFERLKKMVRYIYTEGLYEHDIANSEENKRSRTKNVLTRKLISVIQFCYLHTGKRYNDAEAEEIRLPFSTLGVSLGKVIVQELFLFKHSLLKDLIDPTKNPELLDWVKDPALTDSQKLFSKDIKCSLFPRAGFTRKDRKFIITYVCIEFYNAFYKNENSIKEHPNIFNLLNTFMAPRIGHMERYVEHCIGKLGVVILHSLRDKNVFKSTIVVRSMDMLYDAKKLATIPPFQKERLIKVSSPMVGALKSVSNLERPHLIRKNLKSPVTGRYFAVTDHIQQMFACYNEVEQGRVHDNENSQCVLNDPRIVTHETRFVIDQDSLMTLLSIIRNFFCESKKPFPAIGGRWVDTNVVAFLSLFDITQEQMGLISQKTPRIIATAIEADLYEYLANFDSTEADAISFKRKINKYDIDNKTKQYLITLLDRSKGIKYSLTKLIQDAIIYSHFKNFSISSFLDTRGRQYYRNTSLNIQGYPIIKTIVKLYSKPISRKTVADDFIKISKVFCAYINSSPIAERIHSTKIRELWLTRYGYNRKVTAEELLYQDSFNRLSQLMGYLKSEIDIGERIISLEEFLMELFSSPSDRYSCFFSHPRFSIRLTRLYMFVKDKRKLLIVLNIIRTIVVNHTDESVFESDSYLPKQPYPYELDATASGIQMTALILRDSQLAEWCGLKYNPNQVDLYTKAGNIFKTNINNIIHYNIPKLKINPKISLEELDEYIPEEMQWFVDGEHFKNIKSYIEEFINKQSIIKSIFADHAALLEACYQRDLWKKSVMTYGYNSTPQGRIADNINYFVTQCNIIADSDIIDTIATLVEAHFSRVTQPLLIPNAEKIKLVSRILAYSLKSNEENTKPIVNESSTEDMHNFKWNFGAFKQYTSDEIEKVLARQSKPSTQVTITNEFITHKIRPVQQCSAKVTTNSYKGADRGPQVSLSFDTYDKGGNLMLNDHKAQQLIGPNLAHCTDANVVHMLHHFVTGLSDALKEAGIRKIYFTSTHDSFGFVDTYFAKSILEFIYLIVHKQNPIKSLAHNSNYKLLWSTNVLHRKFKFVKNKKELTRLKKQKFPRVLNLSQLDDKFVK
jgi:DNA-dependent RNA polymerase